MFLCNIFPFLQLSPALRNRFTEIWCPLYADVTDHVRIVTHNLRIVTSSGMSDAIDHPHAEVVASLMLEFVTWMQTKDRSKRYDVTQRK